MLLQPEEPHSNSSLQARFGFDPYSHSRPTSVHAPPELGGLTGQPVETGASVPGLPSAPVLESRPESAVPLPESLPEPESGS
jgi:hypothetical protein